MNALMSMMPFAAMPFEGGLRGPHPKRRQGPMPLGMPQGPGKGQPMQYGLSPMQNNSMMNFHQPANFQPLMNYGRMVQRY